MSNHFSTHLKHYGVEIGKDGLLARKEVIFTSLFGCDGGNPRAKLWVLGLEWGGTLEEMKTATYAFAEAEELALPSRPQGAEIPVAWRKSSFDLRLARFASYLEYGEIALPNPDQLISELYKPDGILFKLNLYPLACRTMAHWPPEYANYGSGKADYQSECDRKRLPFLRQFILSRCPENALLLAFGLGTKSKFLHLLGWEGAVSGRKFEEENLTFFCYDFSQGRKLIILPFPGFYRHCIQKKKELPLALRLRSILKRE